MRKDQIFVLLLVVLLPLTGCFDGGGIGDADAQDSTESENSGTSVTTTQSLRTHFTTISPSNLNCGDDDVCVWEYAMTINTTATEAIEVMSYSSTIEGSYYEQYDGSTRTRTTTGTAFAVSTCNSGHSWNNTIQLTDYYLLNSFLPTVGDVCQHEIFVQGQHNGSPQSNTNITEIQFSLTWTVHPVTLV
jgi:hypothetical protein